VIRFPGQLGIDSATGATRRSGAGRAAPVMAISAGHCAPKFVEIVSLVPQGRAAAP
jgi:hypothetical protein